MVKSITKRSTFAEVIEQNPDAEKIFQEEGMFCAGCPMAQFESIEEGSMAHGINADSLMKKLKNKSKPKKSNKKNVKKKRK